MMKRALIFGLIVALVIPLCAQNKDDKRTGVAVSGVVVSARDGKPVARVQVHLFSKKGWMPLNIGGAMGGAAPDSSSNSSKSGGGT